MIRGGFPLQTFGRRLAGPTANICGFSSMILTSFTQDVIL
jgi:hypothetical protein